MNPTIQSINNSKEKNSYENITLEQMDVLGRKCHHLHDEEILLRFSQIFKMIGHMFRHEQEEQHQPLAQ